MNFSSRNAEIFVPDGLTGAEGIARTTHLAVGAHADDIPIMGFVGIQECFGRVDRWFLAVTVTDGAGSPRSGPYARYSDDEMRLVRAAEERKAAMVGEYAAAVLLGHQSHAVVEPTRREVVDDLVLLMQAARPEVVYTHNLADGHDTHVAVALRTIEAIQQLPDAERPQAVFGGEVWRDLDWLDDADKVAFDVGARPHLAAALLGVYDSQIAGGKQYDAAVLGRRAAHATFSEPREVDRAAALSYAMDLTPLVVESGSSR